MNCVNEYAISENKLWEQYYATRDINVRNQIVERYMYIVRIIALKIRGIYQQFGDVEDVVNEGVIALMDVVEKYDITKNVKFETYASIRIKGAIIDYVRKQDWTPRKVKTDIKTLQEAEKELALKLGREPRDSEIAEFLNIRLEQYDEIIRNSLGLNILSYEELVGEAKMRGKEFWEDQDRPEDAYGAKELKEVLKESINQLSQKEKLVISLYYKDEIKLKDIANILEVSNSRASQIHSAALEKLQKSLREYMYGK